MEKRHHIGVLALSHTLLLKTMNVLDIVLTNTPNDLGIT
jgi:hypothetical protein